jgi:zinc transport system ATP-binding protein
MLLSAKDITIKYENKIAVEGVSFDVASGDYLCIFGENGSGKSTLIKSVLGLIKSSSGKIEFSDDINKNQIGYLPQQTIVQKDFPASVFEVVLSGCLNRRGLKPFFSKKEKDIANNNIEKLSISEIINKSYRDLSCGQQRRVLLARALCATERLIVLDEPAAGLDPLISSEFYLLVKNLNKKYGISVIMVSHDIKTALKNANKILHMGTKALFFGTTADYIKNNISNSFMEESCE